MDLQKKSGISSKCKECASKEFKVKYGSPEWRKKRSDIQKRYSTSDKGKETYSKIAAR
jgi:hypothetical protein